MIELIQKNSSMEFNQWGHSFCEETGVNHVALIEGWSQHSLHAFPSENLRKTGRSRHCSKERRALIKALIGEGAENNRLARLKWSPMP